MSEQNVKRHLVQKRDGRVEPYDPFKIQWAVERAFQAKGYNPEEMLLPTKEIVKEIEAQLTSLLDTQVVTIAEIHKHVENQLMTSDYKDVARAYIEFRSLRDQEVNNSMSMDYTISRLLAKDPAVVNENANKDAKTYNTNRDLTAGAVAKSVGLSMLPPRVAQAHIKGDIHYHDLTVSPYDTSTNCSLINFEEMLSNGFRMGNADIGTPRSIQTATAVTAQIFANVGALQQGGMTFDRIDEVLAPYASLNYNKHKKELEAYTTAIGMDPNVVMPDIHVTALERTRKDIYDAFQGLEHEINTLFTSQGQTPFTSIGFGLGETWYAREIQKAILEVRLRGLGDSGKTAIFPKLLFTIKDGLNLKPEDPNYDIKQLALKCAQKRIYPDILSYEKIVEITGSFKASMGK